MRPDTLPTIKHQQPNCLLPMCAPRRYNRSSSWRLPEIDSNHFAYCACHEIYCLFGNSGNRFGALLHVELLPDWRIANGHWQLFKNRIIPKSLPHCILVTIDLFSSNELLAVIHRTQNWTINHRTQSQSQLSLDSWLVATTKTRRF